jgi:16S rRNA (cytosine1407-C5)-methyltransferase
MAYKSIPDAYWNSLTTFLDSDTIASIRENTRQMRLPTLRINTIKSNETKVREILSFQGMSLISTPLPHAFQLNGAPQKALTQLPVYTQGDIYLQSLSSMLPAYVLNPNSHDDVLDLTAAPGSKTTLLAALMQNQGRILANDNSSIRLMKLKANLSGLGVTNTTVIHRDGVRLWREYPEKFDKTLVDVPCSMEGRFIEDNPKTYQDWSPKKAEQLSYKQKLLLLSGISATKVGGTIVYSTCTLTPEENEAVVDWTIKKCHGAVMIDPIDIKGIPWRNGMTAWGNRSFDTHLVHTKRLLPDRRFEGFFIAKLTKLHSTIPSR